MRFTSLFSLLLSITLAVQAKQLLLRPLSPPEVYQLLASTGRSDAVPQGGIVTQGLAFIDNLTRRLRGGGNGSNSVTRVYTQELCFETRSARNLAEAEAIFGAYMTASNRQVGAKLVGRAHASKAGRILKLKKRKKLRNEAEEKESDGKQSIKNQNDGLNSASYKTGEVVKSSSHRESLSSNPAKLTNTAATMTTNAAAENDEDAGDATISTSTLSTSPEGAIDCIVIKRN